MAVGKVYAHWVHKLITLCRVALAASDPIVAITSIMSQSDEIFASGEEAAKQQTVPESDGNFEVFEDGAEQMSEVAHTESAAPNAGLPVLQGRKVNLCLTFISHAHTNLFV